MYFRTTFLLYKSWANFLEAKTLKKENFKDSQATATCTSDHKDTLYILSTYMRGTVRMKILPRTRHVPNYQVCKCTFDMNYIRFCLILGQSI